MSGSVWYVGVADRRTLRESDWYDVGVADASTVQMQGATWDAANGFSQDVNRFSTQQLGWMRSQDDFYVDAPYGPRGRLSQGGQGRIRVRFVTGTGYMVYGAGVTPVAAPELPSGLAYDVSAPGVRAVRDSSVPSGYTYLIEET